jgi:hypothetical protein
MRAAIAGIAATAVMAATALAAGKLTPSEIQATFTGCRSPPPSQGLQQDAFTPDGKMTREPVGKRAKNGALEAVEGWLLHH